jgi:hypothetical protein
MDATTKGARSIAGATPMCRKTLRSGTPDAIAPRRLTPSSSTDSRRPNSPKRGRHVRVVDESAMVVVAFS